MTRTRRQFLRDAASTAAVVGLGPAISSVTGLAQGTARPHLALARRAADWIARAGQERPEGLAWPADPLRADTVGLDYYNGMPGVVSFFAQLGAVTGEARWTQLAQRGARYLVTQSVRTAETAGDGLYTGLAGHVLTFLTLAESGAGPEWGDQARRTALQLASRIRPVGGGGEWSPSNDIISGTAGIALLLMRAARSLEEPSLGGLAVRACRRLIDTAVPEQGGRMWFPATTPGRNYPNFSHGTAGVAYALATIAEETGDRELREGALGGVTYLDAVATRHNGTRAIFHVSGGGEDRFYMSWCHGPVGTARLFYRLWRITREPRWRTWVDELTAAVAASGAPEKQSAGYWNNISQCCGHVGIGQYCIDLARHYSIASVEGLRQRVERDTMARATDDAAGLRWVQAENRAQPENLIAQTGFMQGAAGVGTFFLQLDALSRGEAWRWPMPDTPWT